MTRLHLPHTKVTRLYAHKVGAASILLESVEPDSVCSQYYIQNEAAGPDQSKCSIIVSGYFIKWAMRVYLV